MGKSRNLIIITGIVVAFIVGTISVAPQASSAGNPVIALINDQVIPKLDSLLTDLGLVKTETDKIQMVKDNQYVPFKTPSTISFLASETCDAAGGLGQQHQLRIDGGSDFMVTGITFQPTGVDQATDQIQIIGLFVDGQSVSIRTGDLTGTFSEPFGFDIAGVPTITGGNVPTSITALGTGSQDIVVVFSCFADTTTDITFPAGSIVVSGWKLASDTITAGYD